MPVVVTTPKQNDRLRTPPAPGNAWISKEASIHSLGLTRTLIPLQNEQHTEAPDLNCFYSKKLKGKRRAVEQLRAIQYGAFAYCSPLCVTNASAAELVHTETNATNEFFELNLGVGFVSLVAISALPSRKQGAVWKAPPANERSCQRAPVEVTTFP